MTIFTYAALPHNPTFAAGLYPAPVARCKPFSLTDAAYEMGRSAAIESFAENPLRDVLPPDDMTPAEAFAFAEGARDGFREADHELEEARRQTATTQDEYDGWYQSLEARDAFIGHA